MKLITSSKIIQTGLRKYQNEAWSQIQSVCFQVFNSFLKVITLVCCLLKRRNKFELMLGILKNVLQIACIVEE